MAVSSAESVAKWTMCRYCARSASRFLCGLASLQPRYGLLPGAVAEHAVSAMPSGVRQPRRCGRRLRRPLGCCKAAVITLLLLKNETDGAGQPLALRPLRTTSARVQLGTMEAT